MDNLNFRRKTYRKAMNVLCFTAKNPMKEGKEMAAYESVNGSPKSRLEHNLRTKDNYFNKDINPAESEKNYSVLERGDGENLKDILVYDQILLGNTYIRKGNITHGEWCCTAPDDLPPELEEAFFRSSYQFLNHFLFNGDDSRCISAQVHCDEIGRPHLHYVFALPEVENPKYVNIKDKFLAGYTEANLSLNKHEQQTLYQAICDYERGCPEKETIHKIKDVLCVTRDEARSVFLKLRRKETEKYETKLVSKDKFLTKEMFKNFHPAYEKWIKEEGFNCSVYKGGKGLNLTVEQLKTITRETGVTLNRGFSIENLIELINENRTLKKEIERTKTITIERNRTIDITM